MIPHAAKPCDANCLLGEPLGSVERLPNRKLIGRVEPEGVGVIVVAGAVEVGGGFAKSRCRCRGRAVRLSKNIFPVVNGIGLSWM